jgi:uncharacterized protein YlxW (UPF0749 family)
MQIVHETIVKLFKENVMSTDQKSLEAAQQSKLLEVQNQQAKLKGLQDDLERLNQKINRHEKLSAEDTKFISNLGWLSALSVSVAAMAASL